MRPLFLLALGLLAGCGAPVGVEQTAAAPLPVAPVAPVGVAVAKPAHFVPTGCSAVAVACVDLSRHLAWLQHRGHVVYGPVEISTGTSTPRGSFHVIWRDRVHTSSEFGTDMPWSVFFAAGGIAFHQGPLDAPSHGCVHLSPTAAPVFFGALRRGDDVKVF